MPDAPKAVANRSEAERISRAERIERDGGVPLFPPIGDGDGYLLEYFDAAGACGYSGGYPVALSSAELAAWSSGFGIDLRPWEFAILRGLSSAYVSQLADSRAHDAPPPFGEPANAVDRSKIASKVSSILGGRARGSQRK